MKTVSFSLTKFGGCYLFVCFKVLKDCFLFKLILFSIKLFVETILSFDRFSNCMGDPWFVIKSSVSFRFNFNWCMVVQGGVDKKYKKVY